MPNLQRKLPPFWLLSQGRCLVPQSSHVQRCTAWVQEEEYSWLIASALSSHLMGTGRATTYRWFIQPNIPLRSVRRASSWLSAFAINTINTPTKNTSCHQAFLSPPLVISTNLIVLSLSLSFALCPSWTPSESVFHLKHLMHTGWV